MKACIVGYGVIDPLGASPMECWSNIINDAKTNLITIEDSEYGLVHVSDTDIVLPDLKLSTNLTKTQKLALHAVNGALHMSQLPPRDNVGVVFSSTGNQTQPISSNTFEDYVSKLTHGKKVRPSHAVNRLPDAVANEIALAYGFGGASVGIQAACATAIASLDLAIRWVNEYEYVICGASDAPSIIDLNGFGAIGALSNKSMPFDDARAGFLMGQGAACFILQSEEKAKEYGSKIYATVYLPGITTDINGNMTSPDPLGAQSKNAMLKALANAGITAEQISSVNAHATSTPAGDIAEYNAITSIFGSTPITALKGKLGHSLGACGAVELVYVIEMLNRRILPKIHNLTTCSYDSCSALLTSQTQIQTPGPLRILKNSFAFGGKCASIVVSA